MSTSARAARGATPERGSDPEAVARHVALDRLSRAPQTRDQLERQLARRGVPPDAAGAVLDRFEEVGLVDDAAFAQAWVATRHAGRGLSRRALVHELRSRGVSGEPLDAALAELSPDTEEATARALVRGRLTATARLEPAARQRRLLALLARKGYPAGLALRVVREEISDRMGDGTGPDGLDPQVDGLPDT